MMKKKFIIIIVLILGLFGKLSAKQDIINTTNINNLSIVIASCDKYAGLWEPFFKLLFQNWPSLAVDSSNAIPIFFISNNKRFNHPRVQNIQIPNEISWSDNMLNALSKVPTKYVLYLQEDYFLTRAVNEELLKQMLEYVKNHEAVYLQIGEFSPTVQSVKPEIIAKGSLNLAEFSKHSLYRTSLQAGIWDKDALIWLIKPGETAVDFELASSKRSEGMQRLFLAHLDVAHDPIKYINAVIGGLLLKSAVDYLHSQNIVFDPKSQPLPLDQDRKFVLFKRKMASMLITNKTKGYVEKFKKFLRSVIYS